MRGKPFNEKVDIYSLGIILCELFVPFNTAMERIHVLTELREGTMPPELVEQHPRVAQLVLEMMVDNHLERPSAKELLERIGELAPVPSTEEVSQLPAQADKPTPIV
jgi:translation initiation factor 2-alpha kinase 1